MSRPVLVARLGERDAAGALTTAHVRAGAQVGGVSVRTVWRWLEAARMEGRMEFRRRARLESDQAWGVLAQPGGNVAVLHQHLEEAGGEVPSLLEYLQSLWEHLGTRIMLVLCGAGCERVLSRLPRLASRSARGRKPRVWPKWKWRP